MFAYQKVGVRFFQLQKIVHIYSFRFCPFSSSFFWSCSFHYHPFDGHNQGHWKLFTKWTSVEASDRREKQKQKLHSAILNNSNVYLPGMNSCGPKKILFVDFITQVS